jgi:hypothetical protein
MRADDQREFGDMLRILGGRREERRNIPGSAVLVLAGALSECRAPRACSLEVHHAKQVSDVWQQRGADRDGNWCQPLRDVRRLRARSACRAGGNGAAESGG